MLEDASTTIISVLQISCNSRELIYISHLILKLKLNELLNCHNMAKTHRVRPQLFLGC